MTTTNHDQVLDRREIAAALLRALERRHEVLDAIVESNDRSEAVATIAALLDTNEQCAEAVLNLPFRRLTKAERKKIRAELEDLDAVLTWTPAERPMRRVRTSGCGRSTTAPRTRSCSRSVAPTSSARPTTTGSRANATRRPNASTRNPRCGSSRRICPGDEPKPVGFAFGELTGHEVEVRIWVRPALRKQGYGTATLKQARTELAAYFPPGST